MKFINSQVNLHPLQNTINLQFYSMYLPGSIESYIKPIVTGPPVIFQSCIRSITASRNYNFFDVAHEKCNTARIPERTTTTTEEPTTTTQELTTEGTSIDIETPTETYEQTTTDETTTGVEEVSGNSRNGSIFEY